MGINSVVAAWRGVAILLLGEGRMKITKDYTRKDGVRTITVQLAKGEKLMEFKDDSYYRLGGQIDDVVAVHCIIEGKRVYWCSIEQKWVEA